MELNFIGRGAAVNPLMGNTSAYFISNDELFLIDCGESVYATLVDLNILKEVKTLNIFITHLHCDHVGAIGSLLVYTHFVAKIKVNLVVLGNDYESDLKKLLNIYNTKEEQYNIIAPESLDNKYDAFEKVRYEKTIHAEGLDCYSLIFNTKKGIVFYSGDSSETRIIENIIAAKEDVDKMFVDVTSNAMGVVHLYLGDLVKVIPDSLKDKVYCMHFNNEDILPLIKEVGFKAVEIKKRS